jgi:hypothetical protein
VQLPVRQELVGRGGHVHHQRLDRHDFLLLHPSANRIAYCSTDKAAVGCADKRAIDSDPHRRSGPPGVRAVRFHRALSLTAADRF